MSSRNGQDSGMRVLIVDDNVDTARAMKMILDGSGFDARTAYDGEEALRVAREFLPSKPPAAYRIDPFPDPIDVELHRGVRGIDTLPVSLRELRALVDLELGDYRPTADTVSRLRNQVPQHLRPEYDKAPTPMLRLLQSWEYANDANVGLQPNTKDFLRGSTPNWSLIAQGRRFTRDIEDELWDWLLEFATNSKLKSTAAVLLAPAGYGITTILMAIALRAMEAPTGPVFMLREGADFTLMLPPAASRSPG